jgi:hypothetical protein
MPERQIQLFAGIGDLEDSTHGTYHAPRATIYDPWTT